MRRRAFAWMGVICTVGLTACSAPASRIVFRPTAPLVPSSVRVQYVEAGRTVIGTIPLERYVEAAVLSEFAPPAGEVEPVERMYEVQAVISRTYAVANLGRHASEGFDLCATTHCQLYQPARLKTSRWATVAAAAVHETGGTVLWYDGAPAHALFHADCGGHTSSDAAVWGGRSLPYLAGIADDGAAALAHTEWRFETTVEAAGRALDADPRTRPGGRLDAIDVLSRDDSGRVERVAVRGRESHEVRGEDLRQALTRAFGDRTIRSTRFDVRREGGRLLFEGRGFGHGVGLCQAGALARVRAGMRFPAVLALYYPGTDLSGPAKAGHYSRR